MPVLDDTCGNLIQLTQPAWQRARPPCVIRSSGSKPEFTDHDQEQH